MSKVSLKIIRNVQKASRYTLMRIPAILKKVLQILIPHNILYFMAKVCINCFFAQSFLDYKPMLNFSDKMTHHE